MKAISFRMVAAFAALALAGASIAASDGKSSNAKTSNTKTKVFKCEKDGVVVFSQVECGQNAQSVEIELQQPPPDKDYVSPHIKQQQQVQQYLAEQEKAKKLSFHQANIERLKQQLKSEFEALKETRFRTPEDKNAAVKQISDKYNQLIRKEQDAIKALRKKEPEQSPS